MNRTEENKFLEITRSIILLGAFDTLRYHIGRSEDENHPHEKKAGTEQIMA